MYLYLKLFGFKLISLNLVVNMLDFELTDSICQTWIYQLFLYGFKRHTYI